MALSVVQYAQHTADTTCTATFGAAPTPGNVIVAIATRADGPGGTFTLSGIPLTLSPYFQAHASFGAMGRFGYRVYQAGDGLSATVSPSGRFALLIAEIAGLDPAGPVGGFTTKTKINSTTLDISSGPASWSIAGFVTRLRPGGTFAPNVDTTQIDGISIPLSQGGGILGYGLGGATLGGTQGGTTQDGYWYGGAVVAWNEPLAAGGDTWVPPMDAVSL